MYRRYSSECCRTYPTVTWAKCSQVGSFNRPQASRPFWRFLRIRASGFCLLHVGSFYGWVVSIYTRPSHRFTSFFAASEMTTGPAAGSNNLIRLAPGSLLRVCALVTQRPGSSRSGRYCGSCRLMRTSLHHDSALEPGPAAPNLKLRLTGPAMMIKKA